MQDKTGTENSIKKVSPLSMLETHLGCIEDCLMCIKGDIRILGNALANMLKIITHMRESQKR